ncbi:unnamed protein product [Coccothraustes coccothraustes]
MMNCEIQNYFKSCSCYLKRTDKVSAPKDSVSEVCFKNILCSRAPLRGKGPMQQGNKPSLEELMSCASESLVSCGNYNNPVVPMLDNAAVRRRLRGSAGKQRRSRGAARDHRIDIKTRAETSV